MENPTHESEPRPFFAKAWQRDQYHREQAERERELLRELEARRRQERSGRDRKGEVVAPVTYTAEERRDLERFRAKGMSETSTFIRSTHGRVGHRDSAA